MSRWPVVLLAESEKSCLRAGVRGCLPPHPHPDPACRAGCLPWVSWSQGHLFDKPHSYKRDSFGILSGKSGLEPQPIWKITGEAVDGSSPSASRLRWYGLLFRTSVGWAF